MDRQQLGELILASSETMYRVAKSLLRRDAECEDAISEAIVKAFEKIHTLRFDRYGKTWLIRILMNECYKIMRREQKTVSLEEYPLEGKTEEGEDETFEILDTNIVEREEKDINGHKCIFLKRAAHEGLGVDFDRILYVSYPEGNLILQIYTADNVSDEELMKFVEGISLAEFPQEKQNDFCEPQSWSDYLLMLKEEDYAVAESDFKLEATKQEMDHLHSVGSEVDLGDMIAEDEEGNSIETNALTACVKDVQIAEDLSLLDFDYVDEDLKGQTDESGKLRPVTIQYMKDGDGISIVDETLKTEEIQQCLVYVTVDYKNAGDVTLYNILFFANILKLQETEKGYRIFDRASQMQDLDCDTVVSSGMTDSPEMAYFDVHGGNGNGSNYIDVLEPGESKTVHIGFLANKDELDLMYLNLDASGAGYEFTENSLKIGYVDIRQ